MSVSFELDPEVKKKLEDWGKKMGLNLSEFCKLVLESWAKGGGDLTVGRVKYGVQRFALDFPMGFKIFEKTKDGLKEVKKKVGIFSKSVLEQDYWE